MICDLCGRPEESHVCTVDAAKLLDANANLKLQNQELQKDKQVLMDQRDTAYERADDWHKMADDRSAEINRLNRLLREERERCANLAEEFEDWVWPDKKSEAYQEAGDWASPILIESMKKLAAEIRKEPEKRKCEHQWTQCVTGSGASVTYCLLCRDTR